MTVFTLFSSLYAGAFDDPAQDPNWSEVAGLSRITARHNVLFQSVQRWILDDGDTRTVSFSNYATSQWVLLVARVIGTATLNVTGQDTAGGAVTGKLQGYGTSHLPGYVVLSGTKVDAGGMVVEGQADGTVVELMAAISCEDDDPLLETNA